MEELKAKLAKKLSKEEYELALKILELPVTKVREFVESLIKEAEGG